MSVSSLRTDEEIVNIYERHIKMLYRICFSYMKNAADAEDAVQNTFFQLIRTSPFFQNAEHEKAWLIRTASNLCKNELKRRKKTAGSLEEHSDLAAAESARFPDVLRAVFELPDKYKTTVYLYYYEGYSCPEIAKILKKPQSTVRNYLHEARGLLRERLGEDFLEE